MKKLFIALTLCSFFAYQVTETRENVSGKTHLRTIAPFESGSAMRVSAFNHEVASQHQSNGNKGGFQVSVFGGKNTKKAAAAAYFMPYGHKTLTFQGQQAEDFTKLQTAFEGRYTLAAEPYTAIKGEDTLGTTAITLTRFTKSYDNNVDTSIVRPWNFGITYAATQDIYGGATAGVGIYSHPTFKASISPEFNRSHAGAAAAFRYHFSEDPKSFWFEASTAVEWVRTEVKLNEVPETDKTDLTEANFIPADIGTPLATVTADLLTYDDVGGNGGANNVDNALQMNSEVALVWINARQDEGSDPALPTGTYWPVKQAVTNGGDIDITSVEHAFKGGADVYPDDDKKIWNYGKVDGARKKTRLADVELKMGYNFVCTPTYKSNGYLGVVIPTGNKATGEFLGEALVGNGKHFGLMAGGTTSIELSMDSDWNVSYRIDTNGRYLFKNTQTRSFDLKGNEWSRYLMVWEKEKWEAAFLVFNGTDEPSKYSQIRNYSAGINFFTKDMYVTPGFQGRINQSMVLQSEKCLVEFGWNIFAREAEKVTLTSAWSENIAFPEATISPFVEFPGTPANNPKDQLLRNNGLLLSKNNKTFNNDALTTTQGSDIVWNSAFEITEAMLNLESAASPQVITHTPYVSANYTWGDTSSDRPGSVGVGASYEFAQNNNSLNQWQLWGKLGFCF